MKVSPFYLLLIASILPFMVLIVSPLSIYCGNIHEISFGLIDVAFPIIGIFLCITILLLLFLLLFQRYPKLLSVFTGLLVGLAISTWIQSQLLVWNFGPFRGQGVDWSKWELQKYLDALIWILVITGTTLLFIWRKKKLEIALITGVYLLGFLSVINSFASVHDYKKESIEIAEYKKIFSFHPDNNVLIIILDAFQSDYFDLIATSFPEEVHPFDGFTFYRNTISRFPTTKGSIPSILTGTASGNNKYMKKYLAGLKSKPDLIKAYKNKSYITHFVGLEATYPEVIPMSWVVLELNSNVVHPVYIYLDYAAFRALPTCLKDDVYDNGNWFLSFMMRRDYPPDQHGYDIRFLELFEKYSSLNQAIKGSFKILHFFCSHPPFNVNEDLHFDPSLKGETGYIRQARGALKLADRVLTKLKELGLYDKSEIFIISDHGSWEFLPGRSGDLIQTAYGSIPLKVISSSHALLLHKPLNTKGALRTSMTPMEISDLPCLLGLQNFKINCDEHNKALLGNDRNRTFYFYDWEDDNNFQSDSLPAMTEYIIRGSAGKPENYRKAYQTGTEIKFSSEDTASLVSFLGKGWSWQEPTHRWTDGDSAALSFQLDHSPHKDLVLRLWGLGFNDLGKTESRIVQVIVNGNPVALWDMCEEKQFRALIPCSLAPDGLINIVFRISNPIDPSGSIHSLETRRLGMMVKKVVIEEKP
jgi:hypothetical protein